MTVSRKVFLYLGGFLNSSCDSCKESFGGFLNSSCDSCKEGFLWLGGSGMVK